MRRYVSIVLGLVMVLGLTGCNGSSKVGAEGTAQSKKKLAAAPKTAEGDKSFLKYQVTTAEAPKVYFTKDVSSAGLMKVYKALDQHLQGKVGIKVSFGGADEPYLDPKLMTELVKTTKGTFIETCGFTPPRDTPSGNLAMAREHGFTDVGAVDILDAEGDLDMPVKGGYHLKFARTGSHFKDYDTLVAVHRFKPHYIPIYGGTMKNISLNLGSLSGHALIHSAGENDRNYEFRNKTITAEAFADAAKAALDYKPNRWVFLNVLADIKPTDSCVGAKSLGDIGIIASKDPVAVDQAACDYMYGAATNQEERATWEATHSVIILEKAEKIGVGKRHYQLISVD